METKTYGYTPEEYGKFKSYAWKMLISFGLGILVGMRLESYFLGNLLGIASILGGCSVMCKKYRHKLVPGRICFGSNA